MWTLTDNQSAAMQLGNTVLLAVAALAAILGIGTFIFRPRVRRATETPEIPKLQEIKEQQLQAK